MDLDERLFSQVLLIFSENYFMLAGVRLAMKCLLALMPMGCVFKTKYSINISGALLLILH